MIRTLSSPSMRTTHFCIKFRKNEPEEKGKRGKKTARIYIKRTRNVLGSPPGMRKSIKSKEEKNECTSSSKNNVKTDGRAKTSIINHPMLCNPEYENR